MVGYPDRAWPGSLRFRADRPTDALARRRLSGKLEAAAKAHGWKADMVWFKIVNEVPDA